VGIRAKLLAGLVLLWVIVCGILFEIYILAVRRDAKLAGEASANVISQAVSDTLLLSMERGHKGTELKGLMASFDAIAGLKRAVIADVRGKPVWSAEESSNIPPEVLRAAFASGEAELPTTRGVISVHAIRTRPECLSCHPGSGKWRGVVVSEVEAGPGVPRSRKAEEINILLLALLAALGGTLTAFWYIDRVVVAPIKRLAAAMGRMSLAKPEAARISWKAEGEIAVLVSRFNEMLGRISLDVAQGKRSEERLARQAQELARSNADLRQFAHVASHDLKEPLRMVSSYTQLLAKRYAGKLDAEADEFIAFAADGALRMQALIDDLLSYARIDIEAAPFKSVDCGEAAAAVAANLKVLIGETGARVSRDPLPIVTGNATQLIELFQNLIANAIKFRAERPPEVRLSARRVEGAWEFAVQDNGIGIEAKHFERIFVIFQRLHSGEKYPGTGIGLSLCKKIVERHGGRIWLESQPGQGSTFFFTLPDAQSASGELRDPGQEPAAGDRLGHV